MPLSKTTKFPSRSYSDDVSYELSDSRQVNLFGEIDTSTYQHIVNVTNYLRLKNKRKPIEILMNSYGGSVMEGLAIYDHLKSVNKTTPIHIMVNGACMSIATVILQTASLRQSRPNSEFLLHEVSYGSIGRNSDNRDRQKQAQKLQDKIYDLLALRLRLSRPELEELTLRKDYTISTPEALEVGLIDQIVE